MTLMLLTTLLHLDISLKLHVRESLEKDWTVRYGEDCSEPEVCTIHGVLQTVLSACQDTEAGIQITGIAIIN